MNYNNNIINWNFSWRRQIELYITRFCKPIKLLTKSQEYMIKFLEKAKKDDFMFLSMFTKNHEL